MDMRMVLFISELDKLARRLSNGVKPFSEAKKGDSANGKCRPLVFVDGKSAQGRFSEGMILTDFLIDENHRDMISHYDDVFRDIGVNAALCWDGSDLVLTVSDDPMEYRIIIDEGYWTAGRNWKVYD